MPSVSLGVPVRDENEAKRIDAAARIVEETLDRLGYTSRLMPHERLAGRMVMRVVLAAMERDGWVVLHSSKVLEFAAQRSLFAEVARGENVGQITAPEVPNGD